MYRVSVFYPQTEGESFDHEHYRTKHLELVKSRLGSTIGKVSIDRGIAGGEPDSPPTFTTIWNMEVEDLEAFQKRFTENLEEIAADVGRVTAIPFTMQISEVLHQDG